MFSLLCRIQSNIIKLLTDFAQQYYHFIPSDFIILTKYKAFNKRFILFLSDILLNNKYKMFSSKKDFFKKTKEMDFERLEKKILGRLLNKCQ